MLSLRRPEQFAAGPTGTRRCSPSAVNPAVALALRIAFSAALVCAGANAGAGVLASAQDSVTGAVHGVVRDASGAPVAGAAVTLRTTGNQVLRETATQEDGSFLLPGLAPGDYTLGLDAVGAINAVGAAQSLAGSQPGGLRLRHTVTVRLGETEDLRLQMRPVAAGITVLAESQDEAAPLDAGTGTTFARAELASVPTEGLRWQDFALLAPGVGPDENGDGLVSVHGLEANENTELIDGADDTQSFNAVPAGTGSLAAASPDDDADAAEHSVGAGEGLGRGRRAGAAYGFSLSAVREFRVSTQSYTALSGHAAGGVITSVSRSGSDKFHGSAFFILRSSALAARNGLSVATSYRDGVITSGVVKPHDLRENFGATLSGPVGRFRAAQFFYSYDQQRRGFPAITSPGNPNFYRLTSVQHALLANRGVSAAATNAALNYLSSLTGPADRRSDQTLNFGRLDWQARPRIGVGVEYNRLRYNAPAGLIDAPVVTRARNSIGNAYGSVDTVLARLSASHGAGFVNEARVAWTHDLQFESAQPPLAQEPAVSPVASNGQPQAPEVVIGPDGLLFGTPANLSRQAYPDEQRVQVSDIVSVVHGRHLVQLGGEFALVDERVAALGNAAGSFHYDSRSTRGRAGGLVDFITDQTFNVNAYPNGGCPSIFSPVHLFCFTAYTQSFGVQSVRFQTLDWAGFVEDTWRPRTGLTLHLGVRYEYTRLPLPQAPNATLDAVFRKLPGAGGTSSVFPEDRNNVGPRVAAAWRLPARVGGSVRTGYGVFFGRLPGTTIRSALTRTALPSSTTRIRLTPSAVVECPQVANQGFGYPCAFLTQPFGTASTTSAMVFDRHFRLPAIQQASLSYERTLGPRVRGSIGGIMDIDRQLPGSSDLNIAPATATRLYQLVGGTGAQGVRDGETFALPIYTARRTPNFGPVTDILSNGNASYFGLVLSLDARLPGALSVRANYTRSRAIDYGESASGTPRTNGQLDPFTNGYDKGLSSLNYLQLFHATAVWSPRSRFERPVLRQVAQGWQIATLVRARSGRPISYDLAGGTRLPGGHQSLNGSGGALYLPTVGRNTLRLPPSVTMDLRVARSFAVERRVQVRASAEAFNLLNHRNLSSVSQRAYLVGRTDGGVTPLIFQDAATVAAEGLNTLPFGTPTAAGTRIAQERRIQLSLRVEF